MLSIVKDATPFDDIMGVSRSSKRVHLNESELLWANTEQAEGRYIADGLLKEFRAGYVEVLCNAIYPSRSKTLNIADWESQHPAITYLADEMARHYLPTELANECIRDFYDIFIRTIDLSNPKSSMKPFPLDADECARQFEVELFTTARNEILTNIQNNRYMKRSYLENQLYIEKKGLGICLEMFGSYIIENSQEMKARFDWYDTQAHLYLEPNLWPKVIRQWATKNFTPNPNYSDRHASIRDIQMAMHNHSVPLTRQELLDVKRKRFGAKVRSLFK